MSKALASDTRESLLYFSLLTIIKPVYIQYLTEMIPQPSQNTVDVCNETILLILCYICSKLVTLLKVTDAPTEISDIF
jgi:hypothetical protein